jgi:hypothetical protein
MVPPRRERKWEGAGIYQNSLTGALLPFALASTPDRLRDCQAERVSGLELPC